MASAATITPPPLPSSHLARRQDDQSTIKGQNGVPQPISEVVQAYSSIWNSDCQHSVQCFVDEITSDRKDLPDPQSFSGGATYPGLSFLTEVQTSIPEFAVQAQTSSTSSNDSISGATTTLHTTVPTESSPSLGEAKASHSSPPIGPIVGGVLGGFVLLALLGGGLFLFLRRRRRTTRAPSAEFMHIARQGSPTLSFASAAAAAKHRESMTPSKTPLARQSSLDDHEYDIHSEEDDRPPPPFSPGSFSDPVYEKVSASAALREHYSARDHEPEQGGYKD
ncbi:hypothetical protein C8Q74DRAFT_1362688 [Fomes fomentarius]|nr:hypothetical protein C8Q74DRAFT_1362688 [Fomes fomentarius]